MQNTRKTFLTAIAMIAVGLVLFIVFLAYTGGADGDRPLTMLEWVVGGILLGPGFGRLIQWQRQRVNKVVKNIESR